MQRLSIPGMTGLSALLVLGSFVPARALMVAPPALPTRVAQVQVIVIGKVTGFAARLEPANVFKGDTRQMQIANVKVEDTLLGTGVKEIRVGFFPPPAAPNPPAGGLKIILPVRRYPSVQLSLGQESCLFLTPHPTKKDVFLAQNYYDVIAKTGNANFPREMDEIRKYAKLLANPMTGLKSANAEERFLTAGMLLSRYRRPLPNAKTAPIPAEESKLILQTLATADWNNRNPRMFTMTPQGLFFQLGLTAKDGWKQPRNFREFPAAAQKWLKDNAATYRITRYVPVAPAPSTDPAPSR